MPQYSHLLLALVAAIRPAVSAPSQSADVKLVNGKYSVEGTGDFAHTASWTFTGSSLPAGLSASNYPAGSAHSFIPSNVRVQNGYLNLVVPGGQRSKPYTCGEVTTNVQNIKYASVRTTAILSDPAGVCNGMFFYKSDTQESDIEWLSDPKSQSNGGTRQIFLTNQDANGDGHSTYTSVLPPSNPTTTEHEYRIDWTEGRVQWFVDGVKKFETTQDVPSQAGPWVFNNWSTGDPGWTVGPPAQDAFFKIKQITMYYNTA